MDTISLFLETLNDLERLVARGDDYSMLRASASLRQLLLDGATSLVHVANRDARLKIRFPVCGRAYTEEVLKDDPTFYSDLVGIHTSGPMGHQCEWLPVDGFLATKVLKLGPQVLTVGDLIKHSANVVGGVHVRPPKTEQEEVLSRLRTLVSYRDTTINAAQMKPLILVVLDGLAPLRAALNRAASG